MLIPIKTKSRECIISLDHDVRRCHVTPFRAINFYAAEWQEVPNFNAALVNHPIDWFLYARNGIDVRFLMCEIIRLDRDLKVLAKMVQMDLAAGRWLLKSLENERNLNLIKRDKFSRGLDEDLKEWLHPTFDVVIHTVRCAIARKIASDAIDALGNF